MKYECKRIDEGKVCKLAVEKEVVEQRGEDRGQLEKNFNCGNFLIGNLEVALVKRLETVGYNLVVCDLLGGVNKVDEAIQKFGFVQN